MYWEPTEVEWRKHGFEGSRLGYLLNGAGFFHQAHRAVDDCHPLLEILSFQLPTTGTSALAVLLEHARRRTMRVWAEQSPFDRTPPVKATRICCGKRIDSAEEVAESVRRSFVTPIQVIKICAICGEAISL
jgi:hypothetical protein